MSKKDKIHSDKHNARMLAFTVLFAYFAQDKVENIDLLTQYEKFSSAENDTRFSDEPEHALLLRQSQLACDRRLAESIIRAWNANSQQYAEYLQAALSRPLEQLSAVERSLLCCASAELFSSIGTPAKVVIEEYVILAREYGTDKGYTIVNGVLDKLCSTHQLWNK